MSRRKTPWVQARIALRAVALGAPQREAAVVAGVSSSTVGNLIVEYGMVCNRARKPRPDALTVGRTGRDHVGGSERASPTRRSPAVWVGIGAVSAGRSPPVEAGRFIGRGSPRTGPTGPPAGPGPRWTDDPAVAVG